MSYTIIGTAGHVDHGKSSLIKELTGFWGDETKEEKRRGITIDLSFSYLRTDDKTIGFIDVPGHEKLISTMISGAFGFDGFLLVIDANEGVMPQTTEHLNVLNFLGVTNCIIALSKCDLADENLIKNQIKKIEDEFKKYKNLTINSIVKCSIKDKSSIQNLKHELLKMPKIVHEQKGVFRYFIDRIFSIKGHGLVVTGTVLDGVINENDKVWISEISKTAEIKSLQVHEQNVKSANSRQRVAINLNKIKQHELKKGMLITQKGYIRGFKNIDIFISVLPTKVLPHNAKISLFLGSKKINGTLLQIEGSQNFTEGFCSFFADEDIFSVFYDKCIILYKGEVIAGGVVINPINDPIKKRQKFKILSLLKSRSFKEVFLLLSKVHKRGFGLVSSFQRFGLSHKESLEFLSAQDDIFLDEKALIVYQKDSIKEAKEIVLKIFEKNSYALVSEKSLSLKHKWISEKLALYVLSLLFEEKKVTPIKGVWAKTGIDTKSLEESIQNKIFAILKEGNFSPLAPYNIYDNLDIDRKTGDNALKVLTKAKKVVRLKHNFFVTSEALSNVMNICRIVIKNDGFVDIKNLKNRLPFSRKYLIAYLEYLDKFDDILQNGTKRVFKLD